MCIRDRRTGTHRVLFVLWACVFGSLWSGLSARAYSLTKLEASEDRIFTCHCLFLCLIVVCSSLSNNVLAPLAVAAALPLHSSPLLRRCIPAAPQQQRRTALQSHSGLALYRRYSGGKVECIPIHRDTLHRCCPNQQCAFQLLPKAAEISGESETFGTE